MFVFSACLCAYVFLFSAHSGVNLALTYVAHMLYIPRTRIHHTYTHTHTGVHGRCPSCGLCTPLFQHHMQPCLSAYVFVFSACLCAYVFLFSAHSGVNLALTYVAHMLYIPRTRIHHTYTHTHTQGCMEGALAVAYVHHCFNITCTHIYVHGLWQSPDRTDSNSHICIHAT